MNYWIMYIEDGEDWATWKFHGSWYGDTPWDAVKKANLPARATQAWVIPVPSLEDRSINVYYFHRGGWIEAE